MNRDNIDVVDLASGLFLIATALLTFALSSPLRLGTAMQMGPGYVPRLLFYLQISLGTLIVARSFVSGAHPIGSIAARPILGVLASVTFFAFALERLGLPIAVVGLVLLSCLAHSRTRPLEAVLLSLGLAMISIVIFILALGLTIPMWPRVGT